MYNFKKIKMKIINLAQARKKFQTHTESFIILYYIIV